MALHYERKSRMTRCAWRTCALHFEYLGRARPLKSQRILPPNGIPARRPRVSQVAAQDGELYLDPRSGRQWRFDPKGEVEWL